MPIQKIKFDPDIPEITQFYGDEATFAPTGKMNDEGNREFETISVSDKPTQDFRRVMPESLDIVNSDFDKGAPVMVNHITYGEALPRGKTTSSKYIKSKQIVLTKFYLDDEDYNSRILKGIDNGSITDVSIGAIGKYKCSFDGTPIGFFGCEQGHRRGQEIMVDKNGQQTESPNEAVTSVFILAEFYARLADELSIAWTGAVPDASITRKYNSDPYMNQQIVDAVKSAYDANHIDDYDLQRLTASFGGVQSILGQASPKRKIFLPNKKREVPVVDTEYTPEIKAIMDEKDTRIETLESDLQAALDTNQEQAENSIDESEIQAKDERIAELETENAELKATNEAHEAKSDLYDGFVVQLQSDLKKAKKLAGASEDELTAFNASVDQMGDAAAMSRLLDEIKGNTKPSKNFSRIIKVNKEDEKPSETVMDKHDAARIAAAY